MSEKSISLTLKSIIFKKYLILSKIDEGSFGSIYLSKNILSNEQYAVKIENRKIANPLLEGEAFILFYLKGPGLPEVKTFGKTKHLNILIQTLLGPSLSSLSERYLINFTIKDICLLSIQMIERLEYIHSKRFIHRDIKPQNFLMGVKDPETVYLIDFGLAKKFMSKKGKHIKFNINNNITGTPRYCSINALRGAEQSRRDDLESLFYVIMYFFRGNLPWQNLKIKSRQQRFNKINEIKKNYDYKLLCKNLPRELYNLGIYIKHLKFEETPNYVFIKKCFNSILENIYEKNDNKFSWINKFNNNNSDANSAKNSAFHKNNFRQRNSSHKRLYEKISSSLEKKLVEKSFEKQVINLKTQTNNNTKDNITLKSINIEKNLGNINRSNSYVGNSIFKALNLKQKRLSLINKIINKNNNLKIINAKRNNNREIKRNKTQFYDSEYKSKLFLGELYNNQSDIYKYNSNFNESLKNIFLRKNKIIYTSPNLILNLKKNEKSKSIKNVKQFYINKENKSKIINRNKKIEEIKKFSQNKYITENGFHPSNKILNISSMINKKIININNNNKHINNNQTFKKKLNLKMNNIYLNMPNKTHNKSYSNLITQPGKINKMRNNGIRRTNTEAFLRINNNNSNYNSVFGNELNLYNPINLSNMDYFKNRNINLNIKLINNNNYNNILLKNSKDKLKKLNNKIINIDINKNIKHNNINRIIKYKTHRKISTSANNFNLNEFKYGVEENLQNKIKIMNIPVHKSKLDKKIVFNNSNF